MRFRLMVAMSIVLAGAMVTAGMTQVTPPAGQTTPAPGGRGGGRGGGGGGGRAGAESFPAQQRPSADPALVDRGRTLYSVSCSACHGVDARGGQLNGPNLLRSQLVLNDQNGELITPVVQQGRPGTAMVAIQMSAADVSAIAAFLHSLQAASRGQGAPPPGPPVELNIVVGSARDGEAYFAGKCAGCHSATGDLRGIATRIPDPKTLQNTWVAGGSGRGGNSPGRQVTATVTMPDGSKVEGRLVRIDDFLVTLALADGRIRSIPREGPRPPRVVLRDPMDGHRALLPVLTNKDMRDVTAYLVTLK